MNNKEYNFSAFKVSENGTENNYLFDALQAGIKKGTDPLQLYACYEELTNEDMAFMLRCDVSTYEQHVKAMNSDRGVLLSPLQPANVLYFCVEAGIHPTWLGRLSVLPLYSFPPHIYGAIRAVAFGNYSVADREQATAALQLEDYRYNKFMKEHPESDKFFGHLEAFIKSSDDEMTLARNIKAGMSELTQGELKRPLLETFNNNGLLGVMRPEEHILNYMHKLHENFGVLKSAHDSRRLHALDNRSNLEMLIGIVFGSENIKTILNHSNELSDLVSGDDDMSRDDYVAELETYLKIKFEFKDNIISKLAKQAIICNRPEQAVHAIAEGYFRYLEIQGDTRSLGNKIGKAERYMKDFDKWASLSDSPDASFIQYLYSNRLLSTKKLLQLENMKPDGPVPT